MTKRDVEAILDSLKEYVKDLLLGWGLSDEEKSLVAFEQKYMPYTEYSGKQSVDHVLFRKFLRRLNEIYKIDLGDLLLNLDEAFKQHLLEYNALGELVLRIESDVDILKQKGIYTAVNSLPDIGEANIIYLVPNEKSDDRNIKDEYMWINDKWELIGTTSIDLSGYAEEGWVTNQISAFEEDTVAPISLRVEKVEDSITTKADKSEFNTFALKVKGRHGEQSITLTTNNITQ